MSFRWVQKFDPMIYRAGCVMLMIWTNKDQTYIYLAGGQGSPYIRTYLITSLLHNKINSENGLLNHGLGKY